MGLMEAPSLGPWATLYSWCYAVNELFFMPSLVKYSLNERTPGLLELLERAHCLKRSRKTCMMEAQILSADSPSVLVKATIHLGSETYFAQANKGLISEQLISVKEQSMSILKDFITKHNIPNDVPDEPEEISSEDEDEISPKPPVKKSKKRQ
ncbi:UNVERIFIED_CONTAM: hypothetical protein Scaly_0181500 [Sesamum calycinum]|uniref:Uncharacterized protein n=1 Tax=Sesamum calycinum TaxID=2727403 RepID=A0AAW2T0K7_9LAMI